MFLIAEVISVGYMFALHYRACHDAGVFLIACTTEDLSWSAELLKLDYDNEIHTRALLKTQPDSNYSF